MRHEIEGGACPPSHQTVCPTRTRAGCSSGSVLFGMGEIYPWVSDAGALPAFKAAYLVPWFFVLRAVLYFASWTALAVWAATAYGRDDAMTRAAGIETPRDRAAIANMRHLALLERARAAIARAATAAMARLPEELLLADLHDARASFDGRRKAKANDTGDEGAGGDGGVEDMFKAAGIAAE